VITGEGERRQRVVGSAKMVSPHFSSIAERVAAHTGGKGTGDTARGGEEARGSQKEVGKERWARRNSRPALGPILSHVD